MFFVASKLLWPLVAPETWIVIGLLLVLIANLRGRHGCAGGAAILTLTLTVTIALFPVGELLLSQLERSFPVDPTLSRIEGIIVLGGGEDASTTATWGQPQLNEAGERLTVALALARRFPQAHVVFTGGRGELRAPDSEDETEAKVAEQFFLEQGLGLDRLILEPNSRNTSENARMSFELVHPRDGDVWVLVTSAFHMPRAMLSFHRAGWLNVIPFPVDFRSGPFKDRIGWELANHLSLLNVAVKEYVGLLLYQFSGR